VIDAPCLCAIGPLTFEGTVTIDKDTGAQILCWSAATARTRKFYSCDCNCANGHACSLRCVANGKQSEVAKHRLHSQRVVKLDVASSKLLARKRVLDDINESLRSIEKLPSGRQIGRFTDTDGTGHIKTRWFCVAECGQKSCEFSRHGYSDKSAVVAHIDNERRESSERC
jgi:hypothetical protein